MITYIVKAILCSSILIVLYYIFLEREKIYKFNRFYLLFSLVFPFIVPLMTIRISSSVNLIPETINLANNSFSSDVIQQTQTSISSDYSVSSVLILFYIIVTALLLCRFLINILVILFKIKNNNSVPYSNARLVLTEDKSVPYSFLNYIFILKEDYERGSIEKEIIGHELAHVRQKHSLDILFFELLKCFLWFNPLLFLYRKAIQLNHEFLADEFVIKSLSDLQTYQLLLIDRAIQTESLVFSSSFNYLLIKRRIIMMTKKDSKRIAVIKQCALIPVIITIAFIFATRTVAQNLGKVVQLQQTESTKHSVPPELLKEYQDITNKYNENIFTDLTKDDRERLEKIFFQMSIEQQSKQMYVFIPKSSMILPRIIPTKEQLESFKDSKIFRVRIDGNMVSNEILNKYKNTDFSYVSQSKLMKNAKNFGEYTFQVELMTNDGYQNYYNNKCSEKGSILALHKRRD